MKQCPKCKANLEENARFCLYCMTSLDTKQSTEEKGSKKWWLIILAALLALSIIIGSLFIFLPRDEETSALSSGKQEENSSDTTTSDSSPSSSEEGVSSEATSGEEGSSANSSSEESGSSSSGGSSSGSSSGTAVGGTPSGGTNGGTNGGTSGGTNSSSNNGGTNNGGTNSGTNGGADQDTSSSTPSTPATPEEDEEETTPDPVPSVVYLYRDAIPADDYMSNPSITNGGVVITGVKTASSNGVYEIPEKIDGKNVVAIMNAAFCDNAIKDTVKTVIIPKTVKTINAYAFYYCYNLTDIYIKGEAVGCPSAILPEKAERNFTITIHASGTCHDRNFRTYKTLCEMYWEVQFKEWKG